MDSEETTSFLNVDLDLHAQVDMTELLRALEPEVIVLHHELRKFATVEIGGAVHGLID